MSVNEVSSAASQGRPNTPFKIEEIIAQQGMYVCTVSGVSMYPMLRNRRDTIIVTPCECRLKKHDVPLYRRGDQYVLHRIIKVLPDAYVIRGDNCMRNEYGITDDKIIGVLTGFYRGDKQVRMDGAAYRAYIYACRASYPVRYVYYWTKSVLRHFLRKKDDRA